MIFFSFLEYPFAYPTRLTAWQLDARVTTLLSLHLVMAIVTIVYYSREFLSHLLLVYNRVFYCAVASRVPLAPMPLPRRYFNKFKEVKKLSNLTWNDRFSGNSFISFVTTDPPSPRAGTVWLFLEYGLHWTR